jgi:hypothetical protein
MIVRDGPKRPRFPISIIHPLGPLFKHLPLSLRRHLLFLRAFGKWGNFRNPRTFREKAQWRTINDRRVRLTFAQDKLAAKEYLRQIAKEVGEPLRIPETLWVGTDVRQLRALADQLPARWVLKPNHSAGRYVLIDSTLDAIDWEKLFAIGEQWAKRDEEELVMGHWAYGQARHLLIAEERVGHSTVAPNDFKVSCFDGEPGYLFWADRSESEERYAFFEPDGTPFHWGDPSELKSNSTAIAGLPNETLRTRMLKISACASAPFDWIRVDFYVAEGEVWFGELTLYGAGGLYVIDDQNNDRYGARWKLPDLNAPDPREDEWRALLEGVPKGTLQR